MQPSCILSSRRTAALAAHIRCLLRVPVIALLLSGCAVANRTDSTSESVHGTLKALAEKHHVCGVKVAVTKNRQLDSMDCATACLPASTLNADSVFQAASLSKPVFAYAVLKLVAQGRTTMAVKKPIAAYSLHATTADYAKFLATLLNDDDAIEQLTASPVTVDPGLGLK